MGNRVQLMDWACVEALVARVRNQGQMLTNFFVDPKRMSEWCSNGSLFVEEGNGVSLIWRDQGSFRNLYFFATSADALSVFLRGGISVPRVRVVTDVIGPDMTRLPIVAAFQSAGFSQISELVRMSRKPPECTGVPMFDVHLPNERDILDIQVIFHKHFNPEVEQLPTDAELRRWISNRGILAHRDELGTVRSFVIFDLNQAALYLRYWFVDPRVRNSGVGSALMKTMFYLAKDTKRQYFWVITDNENAIKRYEHYGFKAESMKDSVLARNFD